MFLKELMQLAEASDLPDVHIEIELSYEEVLDDDNDDNDDNDDIGRQYMIGAFLIKCKSPAEASNLVRMLKSTKDKSWLQPLSDEILYSRGIDAVQSTIDADLEHVKQVNNDKSFLVKTYQLDDFLHEVELKLT